MSSFGPGITVIGENFNTTRKVKASSPRVVHDDGKTGIQYRDAGGNRKIFDVTACMPADEDARRTFMIPHIAHACRQKDLDYIESVISAQERCGAHIIDLCVDELTVYSDERQQWMRWLVGVAEATTAAVLAIDSSDPATLAAGVEAHDPSKGRVAINAFNLEPGHQGVIELARQHGAVVFANATGKDGMPNDTDGRVDNLVRCMELMDKTGIPMEDRFLDALVFPIGTDPNSGTHYLNAVAALRQRYPDVHIFGGHSNVSFGLPARAILNYTFTLLSIIAGCDTVMIDPRSIEPKALNDFYFAGNALTGKDAFASEYLEHVMSAAHAAVSVPIEA